MKIKKHFFTAPAWLMFFTITLMGVAGTLVGARAQRDRDNDHDRDDRRSFQRNDDDWDDHDSDHRHERYAIGLWGDLPYSDNQALYGVPNMIMDMNSQDLAFTMHDGDLKAGSAIANSVTITTCADGLYTQALGYFNALKAPVIFTTGDNDWTDCDRAVNGPFPSLERLDHERTLYFSTPLTLGQHKFHQAVQGLVTDGNATPCLGFKLASIDPVTTKLVGPGYLNGGADSANYTTVPCVENRRWTIRGVTYATLNIQGSCNNLCDTLPDPHEYAVRNAADIAWMQETFKVAEERGSVAIMFFSQGDPGFDATDPVRSPLRDPKTLAEVDGFNALNSMDGFQSFLVALRTQVEDFRKPVAYVHGDSHYFRIDKPFYDSLPADAHPLAPVVTAATAPAQARRVENFTRVETFGDNTFNAANSANDDNNVHWLKVYVDPDSREVFSYQPQIVPGNRVVVPAP